MIFSPDSGVNEREPTLIDDGDLQNSIGAEYRVGQDGLFVARGRDLQGTIAGTTAHGLYEAGFDAAPFVLAHMDDSYYTAPVTAAGMSFSAVISFAAGTSVVVGSHYANRHYLANGVSNARVEYGSTISAYPIGMTRSTFAIGVSLTQGAGNLSAVTGIVYWATEYDSVRGTESMTGASISTGAFTSLDGAVPFVTGLSSNSLADTIRWYRSVDGGGFPDGGFIGSTPIGTTSLHDTLVDTSTLTVPQYGLVSIGGLDTERDEPPPVMTTIFGPFQDSLLGVSVDEPRTLRFTPAGYPDSWPADYAIPMEVGRQDHILGGVVLPGRIGVFCRDSIQVVFRLPRDSDSIFAAGDAQDEVTGARGAVSRRGFCKFSAPGAPTMAACVSRDGIWITDLATSPVPITDQSDWEGRVDVSRLSECRLADDPINRRMVFNYFRISDTDHKTGLWYLDYQMYGQKGIRITYADHGPLADVITTVASDGSRRAVTLDSRPSNGQVYIESTQDVDDSHFTDSSGSVKFLMTTKEFVPGGANQAVTLGRARIFTGAGPSRMECRIYFDRGTTPEFKLLPNTATRSVKDVQIQRSVNSFWLEIQSVGTTSYGVHWIDIENFDTGLMGGRAGL